MPKQKTTEEPAALKPDSALANADLVIVTGMSGAGKLTALKAFEDLGFNAVDNLPIPLLPKFADLARDSKSRRRSALAIDVREGEALAEFPALYRDLKQKLNVAMIFLDAEDQVLQRRYSETRRPHPLGSETTVLKSIRDERARLTPIQPLADLCIETSRLNVHELRRIIGANFQGHQDNKLVVQINSFGFRNGLPPDSDLVFDVRFLPNPNYIPEFKPLTGKHPSVARYIRSFPQTQEFIDRISDLLIYLLPHYIREGKSYLTISFGCTGGKHRSVMIAGEINKRLRKAGYTCKESHRDAKKS